MNLDKPSCCRPHIVCPWKQGNKRSVVKAKAIISGQKFWIGLEKSETGTWSPPALAFAIRVLPSWLDFQTLLTLLLLFFFNVLDIFIVWKMVFSIVAKGAYSAVSNAVGEGKEQMAIVARRWLLNFLLRILFSLFLYCQFSSSCQFHRPVLLLVKYLVLCPPRQWLERISFKMLTFENSTPTRHLPRCVADF